MREKTCCFTGHRFIPEPERAVIEKELEAQIKKLIKRGIIYYEAGGALGFDTLAAQTVLRLREKYPEIKLILVLPCRNQTRGWKEEDILEYERIKAGADKYRILSEYYYDGCMHERNRRLVDSAACCICYLRRNTGGTAYTVNYAKENGVEIIAL